jgi:hypothetical protein
MAEKKFNCDINLQGNTLKNPAFDAGAISVAALSTDPLARSNHTGTQAASTISDLAAVVKAYRLDEFAAPTSDVSFNSHKATGLATPTASGDAATKGYVDGLVNGTKWLAPVICATTANITLSGEQTIDGVVTSASRVLVKNQSTASQNGVYLSAAGSWTRVTDLAAGADAANASMFVEAGTTYADTTWTCSTNTGSAVVGTNSLTFVQFGSGTGYSADESTLHLVGTTFSVKTAGITATELASNAVTTAKIADSNVTTAKIADANVTTAKIADANVTDAKLASTFCKKYAANFGDGSSTSFTITHNLGTKDVIVQFRKNSDDAVEEFAVVATSTTQITVTCNSAPASNAYRVIVIG